uniref:Uncharacterized protein n=1 Tax=Candidatus Kentrum sp. DK TaxID=2126562 RepID=A0A450SJ30_9GAMM|nr:MAG: hypothetical protein BECKDK2373C_GA0170839_103935 [Candidatus Kentron sp. DK]
MNFRKTAIALQPTPNIRAAVSSSEEELHNGVRGQDRALLAALPAVQGKRRQAEEGLVPRSTLFCGSEPTKRAKTALQPLEIVHYSLRAAPCLDAPDEL